MGDHPEEWYDGRGVLARAVVAEMRDAGVLVYAGGLDEDLGNAFHAHDTSGELIVSPGRYSDSVEYLGGMTIVEASDDDAAAVWAGKIAVACGWPQEVRRFKG